MRSGTPAESTAGGNTVTDLRELMNASVVTTTAETSVAEAAAAMVQAKVGSAVVMQGAWLAGILTERDVLRAAASREDLTSSPVSRWMTADPISAGPDMSVDEAAQVMLLNGFRHLPIVEGREIRGVVSIRDLLAARIRRPPKA
jgi:CBS domain-containing protein